MAAMGELFERIGEAQFWNNYPEQVFVCVQEDEPCEGIVIATTNSPAVARWLVDAINALVAQATYTAQRPTGRILQRGAFEMCPEDGPDEYGWSYCVAWSAAGHHQLAEPRQQPSGISIGRSQNRVFVQAMIDRLDTLLHT